MGKITIEIENREQGWDLFYFLKKEGIECSIDFKKGIGFEMLIEVVRGFFESQNPHELLNLGIVTRLHCLGWEAEEIEEHLGLPQETVHSIIKKQSEFGKLVREGCKILEESGMGVHAAVSEITARVNRVCE